ncbi:MAG TPA: PQQ-dependent sugar dehydrogenase [Candidatus Paceibacterota bacterium]
MRKINFSIFSIVIILLALFLVWVKTTPVEISQPANDVEKEVNQIAYTIEEVASGLNTPWSIVFTSPNRILISERLGRLRVIENGHLLALPLHIFDEVSSTGEEGLMSLALDPDYQKNHRVYASMAYLKNSAMFVKVVSFIDKEDHISLERSVIDLIPAAKFHAGSRIAFGLDRKLYITTGDATDKALPQNLSSLAGKILRVNNDGSIPLDNPFSNSPVWSYGHRNSQGIAWHPITDEMYSTEHGPSVFDGPAGGDEINHIVKGGNYGWPLVSHENTKEDAVAPLKIFTPAEAPASAMIYSGKVFSQFKNNLFFGALVGEGLMRIIFDENDNEKIISAEKLKEIKYGRIRDVTESPEGLIYFSTSNRDGRGNPSISDDRIFRIVPK